MMFYVRDSLGRLREVAMMPRTPEIKDVIFNPPATIIFWTDNTKTVVKSKGCDIFDPEIGFAMAVTKKFFGNKGSYYNIVRKYVDQYYEKHSIEKDEYDSGDLIAFLNTCLGLKKLSNQVTEEDISSIGVSEAYTKKASNKEE